VQWKKSTLWWSETFWWSLSAQFIAIDLRNVSTGQYWDFWWKDISPCETHGQHNPREYIPSHNPDRLIPLIWQISQMNDFQVVNRYIKIWLCGCFNYNYMVMLIC
jgi:hypothetical protein